MKFAINYKVNELQSINNTHQIVVEVTRLDELADVFETLNDEHGIGCVIEYFQVPECAQATRLK